MRTPEEVMRTSWSNEERADGTGASATSAQWSSASLSAASFAFSAAAMSASMRRSVSESQTRASDLRRDTRARTSSDVTKRKPSPSAPRSYIVSVDARERV